ncbi:DUF58 domain-containing protein [Marinihelvus fidelis]|uniref:DUF58 domain-containing protein n=1 Tax=Marinihelvus fidelis TaxID=2613842 RepID=A0A5N0TDW6_9GAMM|nr:DUF58 domain-containing protein [Marinihelvus fidelis]KAA9132036.1 DUF58 domain-containing protein [Marinihelvus fidelis]
MNLFGDRLHAWAIERVRRRTRIAPPYRLAYRHVFVLPTVFGMGFGAMLVFTALGGLNFNNNMALLMVFTLGALAAMTTLLAYRDLAGVEIDSVRADPVFAGEPAHFHVRLDNRDPRVRYSLQAALATTAASACMDLPASASGVLAVAVPTERRGWLAPPPFRVETRYPLGLFRAWSWVFPATPVLVYPAPAKKPPPLPNRASGRQGRPRLGDGDQVHGLRGYRPGDALRRVAWRTSARHDTLYTREMESPRDAACELDWNEVRGDTELRLSVLTAWVLQADHRQLEYRLRLPGQPAIGGSGPAHRARCLEALAVYGL